MVEIGVSSVSSLYHEFVDLVQKYSMPINEALNFVSVNVAKALELYPRKGCVAEGSDADLLILNKSMEIDTVIANGTVMMEHSKLCVKGTYEK